MEVVEAACIIGEDRVFAGDVADTIADAAPADVCLSDGRRKGGNTIKSRRCLRPRVCKDICSDHA
jgi:hypothetical protein